MQTLIDFFDLKGLMPHGYCLSWNSLLLWLHVVSDLLLALSFYLIPLSLAYFIRQRKDFPHAWLLASFAGFIVACGTTHLLTVITVWLPIYWLAAYLKVFTALVAVITTVTTIWLVRFALTVPSPAQLQAEIDRNKLIDEERRIALERLQKIASRVPGMVYTFRLFEDGRTCVPYSNEAIAHLFRLSPEQVCEDASAIFACIYADDLERVMNSIRQSAKNLSIWRCEFRVQFDDGTVQWLSANSMPQHEEDGSTLWHGFITDVTEQKQAESLKAVINQIYGKIPDYDAQKEQCVEKTELSFTHIPDSILKKWQETVDLLADIMNLPSALIMKIEDETIEVFVASHSANNPYHVGDKEKWHGLYCETVIKTQKKLLVSNATTDKLWDKNPDIKRGMIAYLGYPINFPNHRPFGTLCVLDNKENHFSAQQERILLQFKNVIETDLAFLEQQSHLVNINQTLRASETRLAALFSKMTNGFALNEVVRNIRGEVIDFRFLEVNPAFEKMTGIARENWVGKCVKEILPNIEDYWIENYAKVVDSGEPSSYENYSNNIGRWFSTYAYKTAPEQFAVLVQDVTEAKQIQNEILATKNKLQATLNAIPDLLFELDLDMRYCDFHAPRPELLAAPPEQMLGKTIVETLPPDAANTCWEALQEALQQGYSVGQQIKLELAQETHWFELSVAIKPTDDEHQPHFIMLSRDITERKCMEEKLRENERKLNVILDSVEAYIYIKDDQYRYQYANKRVRQLFNQPLEAIIGKTDEDFFDTATAINLRNNDRRVLELGERLSTEEINIGKDNSYAVYLSTKQALYREDNSIYALCGISTNITERKRMDEALKASEAKFRSIIDVSPVPMALNDQQQNINFLNPAFIKTFGYDLNDIPTLADWWSKAYPDPEYRQWVVNSWRERLAQAERDQQAFKPIERNIRCKDGSQKIVLASAAMISRTFKDLHLVVLYDITERKQAEAELRVAATVFDAQEGMLISDANEIILNVNHAFTVITGYSAEEVIGKTPRLLCSGRHDKAFYTELWQSLHETDVWRGEVWNRRKNGQIYPEWLTITAVKGNNDNVVTHYVATFTDITESKSFEEHIHRLAFYDPLTKLPNRRLLQERLKHGIEVSHRKGTQLAVLMLDLDKFKIVNDTLGHVAGDELLQQVAECIKVHLREVDTVARLGGDEFIVLIENIEHYEQVTRIADNIIHALSQVFLLKKNHHITIGTSIGISIYPDHGEDVETLLSNADAALYHAKDQGRGCFAYFSEDLTRQARERIALELRLRRAIEQQELSVHFQPQVDIRTGQIIGAEALVRWYDPVNARYIMPSEFIGLAEETGLILAIGEWVLRATCQLGRQWLDQGLPALVLAVNVSPYQFRRCDINVLVRQVLEDTGFPVDYLELEITESGLMENQAHAMSILNNLHNQGVRLAIDDFGTGYSSLAYLKYFPLDVLKIDKTFIDDIPFLQGDMTITATIISMAHHLGFKVLAEGVETQAQLDFLQQYSCDVYQGYLYSKPLPADEFAKMLLNSRSLG